ncbi:MAG TPA: hypothetical protein VFQ78_09605 [Candidatus Udaeobacter sp.]|jgi:hypothetical protein|nr:hypothetical protein [Candidatus Udaeobacter sp.]
MKHAKLLVCLTGLLTVPFVGFSAQVATITVEVIATFDYPGAQDTYATGINHNNEIAGIAANNTIRFGFTRTADSQFSAPIIDPDDTHLFTNAYGLNDSGTVCGSFWGADGVHGFFLSDGTYTTYDVPGHVVGTVIYGINSAGDFVGAYNYYTGFTSIGGKVKTIYIPGGTYITPQGLNSLNQVVGLYTDTASNERYAFYSDIGGQLHFPISAPGGHDTLLQGINDRGMMVGDYATGTGRNGATHGLLFIAPNKFVTVDYAGSASWVILTGINNKGFICGHYQDANNNFHGLLARVRRSAE